MEAGVCTRGCPLPHGVSLDDALDGQVSPSSRVPEIPGLLEKVRREFSGLPVYVGVGDYVKRTAPMDQRQFRRYLETCRRL